MTDWQALTKKILESNSQIRSVTIGGKDGRVLNFEIRKGLQTLSPPGEIGKKDMEVLLPGVDNYLNLHRKYFGHVNYAILKLDKISEIFIGHKNFFFVLIVNTDANCEEIADSVKNILQENLGN